MENYLQKHYKIPLFLLLAVVIYFPVFLHLSYMPFRIWDESILGINAIEMMHNHNYLVTYFFGYPDLYRCKPPLMLWLIILSAKVFGFSELSLRLPSAIAAAVLCIYLFFTLKKITGSYISGFFTVVILVSCQGYTGLHITRSGEYDSVWILFSTIFSLNLFMAANAADEQQQSKYIGLFFIFLTLGVLTKGLACMLQQMPGLVAYVIWRNKLFALLKSKTTYAGLAVFMVFGLGYYFLREYYNHGYLKAVFNQELKAQFTHSGHAFDQDIDGAWVKRFPLIYYAKRMVIYQFTGYIFVFIPALLLAFKLADERLKKLWSFACINGLVFLVVVSFDEKRVPHYNAPAFVYLAILVAAFFYIVYRLLVKQLVEIKMSEIRAITLSFFCILGLLAKPYYDIIKTVYFPTDSWEGNFSESCRFFQQVARGQQQIGSYKLVYNQVPAYGTGTVLACYAQQLAEHGTHIWFARPQQLVVNDKAVVFDSIDKQTIAANFYTDTIQHLAYCNADVVYIKGVKNGM